MCFLFIKKTLRINNWKTRTVMNAKIWVFVICVETIMHLLLYNLHDYAFKSEFLLFPNVYSNLLLTIMVSRLWKLFIQSYSKITQSTQSKWGEAKITSCKHATFLQNGAPHSIWIFLWRMYLIRETFLRYKKNILCLAFSHAKESVFSKKCS